MSEIRENDKNDKEYRSSDLLQKAAASDNNFITIILKQSQSSLIFREESSDETSEILDSISINTEISSHDSNHTPDTISLGSGRQETNSLYALSTRYEINNNLHR